MVNSLLFAATILALPTQLGYHWWPTWALVLGRRIDYLSPTLFLTDILMLLTVVAGIWERRLLPSLRLSVRITCIAIIVMTFVGMNMYSSANPAASAIAWGRVAEYAAFIWYMLVTKPTYATVMVLLTIGATYSSVLAVAQAALGRSVGGLTWWIGERTFTASTPGIAVVDLCAIPWAPCSLALRPYATFPHPNVLGGFLAAVLLPTAWDAMWCTGKFRRRATVVVCLLIFVALVLSMSRSAWLAAIVVAAAGLVIVARRHLSNTKRIMFVGGTTLMLLAVLMMPYLMTLTADSESVTYRAALMKAAVSMVMENPLVGVGLNASLTVLPKVLAAREVWFLQPVHSIYILLLAETGVLGVSLLASALVMTWRVLIPKIHGSRFVRIIPFLVIAIVGAFDHYPLTIHQGQMLLAIAMTLPFLP